MLGGSDKLGVNKAAIELLAGEIAEVQKSGIEVAVVIGGGNFFRGSLADEFGLESPTYIENVESILNKAIYSQNDSKKEIKRIIGQWINGKMTGYCLGFEGPPGIGKT